VSIDFCSFLAMMNHKMGCDTAFVLAYATIMLNTDLHNPRLTGQKRMDKMAFIESNRRTPDMAPLSDVFMGGVFGQFRTVQYRLGRFKVVRLGLN
jgi:Sec7-like guanine-nucleotide exchange factor